MAEFDDLASELVAELTPEFSKSITLVQITPASYDPTTGASTPASEATVAGRGNITMFSKAEIDGENVLATDNKVIFYYASAINPELDRLRFDSSDYQIVDIMNKYYAVEDVFAQVLQCRKL